EWDLRHPLLTYCSCPCLERNRTTAAYAGYPAVIHHHAGFQLLPGVDVFASPATINCANAVTSSKAHMCSITVPASQGRWLRWERHFTACGSRRMERLT